MAPNIGKSRSLLSDTVSQYLLAVMVATTISPSLMLLIAFTAAIAEIMIFPYFRLFAGILYLHVRVIQQI